MRMADQTLIDEGKQLDLDVRGMTAAQARKQIGIVRRMSRNATSNNRQMQALKKAGLSIGSKVILDADVRPRGFWDEEVYTVSAIRENWVELSEIPGFLAWPCNIKMAES